MPASLLLCIDNDDSCLQQYIQLNLPNGWHIRVDERTNCNEILNKVFNSHKNEPFYGIVSDDVVPESSGWNTRLEDVAGNDGLAYGDDGINGSKLATHPCFGGNIIRERGYIALPGLQRLYADNVWTTTAEEDGVLRYVEDVKLTHYHFSNGKAPKDATYEKRHCVAQDKQIYNEWLNSRKK